MKEEVEALKQGDMLITTFAELQREPEGSLPTPDR